MSDEPILVPPIPKPVNKSATKPTYILVAEDSTVKDGIQYYQFSYIERHANYIVIRGSALTKAQAKKLESENAKEVEEKATVNVEVPWHRVVRIDNVTYKQKRTE